MAFPIGPDPRSGELETLFRIQDPFGLRRSITPVFIRDFRDGMFYGCGTSFFVTPFWRQLSAMHVVTDFFEMSGIPVLPNTSTSHQPLDSWIQILFDPGLVFGTRPAGSTLPISTMLLFPRDQTAHPLSFTFTPEELKRVEPSLDLVSWQVTGPTAKRTEFLPIRVGSGPLVAPGDRVMAVGYHVNESTRREGQATVSYREEMIGSIATVIEVHPNWNQDAHLWPRFTVDALWPGGMSGGPVFSEAGDVIGIVSRGGPTWSQGLWLQALPFNEEVFPGIDGSNPGWAKGWGVCNRSSILELLPTRELAEQRASELGPGLTVIFVSTPLGCQGFEASAHHWMEERI